MRIPTPCAPSQPDSIILQTIIEYLVSKYYFRFWRYSWCIEHDRQDPCIHSQVLYPVGGDM